MPIAFDNTYARLPERFFARTAPAVVPAPQLIRLNHALADQLGLSSDWLASPEGIAMLAGNAMPPGAEPLAQAYAGHQFGNFVPQLGDGRAILLGEVVGRDGARRDIQLKGAGRTPFSRGGDGKAALGPVLREYIVSEAMTALGVPSTRALAAVSTGETVQRETPLPGAVFTRVAASHIRVGTFQYFAVREDVDALRELVDTVISRLYPEAAEADLPTVKLLQMIIGAQADLIASWLHLGFIHGVMNTDNMAVSGETIDYGPCAFMDTFHPECVFSAIDRRGRYAWGNQPAIGQWNLTCLAEALLPLIHENEDTAKVWAESALAQFSDRFHDRFHAGFCAKLGLPDEDGGDDGVAFIGATLAKLKEQEIDFTLFFRQLTRVAAGDSPDELIALFKETATAKAWLDDWRRVAEPETKLAGMRAANPILIPRNHRVEEAIRQAQTGDYAPFNRLVDALAAPFEERPEYADLEKAPLPEERVTQTFCGT
ncbi:protein adenylyltransferase SelO [Synoicihabitans lomoniglobus]|uniref:Protein nucleotidyltransferase YdiU n=1 Tax=Synoicihabitans lomoniglobus TaxID=2909285 RepID=A0AAE9ZXU6_9BACT|nr:YdiU family protein [Opitutaceae bacterium LMO-M01]WED65304.1 YdiU family protein [Opitutaceae bacterium LMO-M01]